MAKKLYELQPNDEVAESGDLSNLVTDGDVSSDFTSSNGVKVGKVGGTEMYVPKATASQMGLVKPVAATAAMTQSVGVKSDGTLVTEPGGGGGGSSGHTVYIASTMNTDNLEWEGGYSIIRLHKSDGSYQDVTLNAASKGTSYSDVVTVEGYGATGSDLHVLNIISYRRFSQTSTAYGWFSTAEDGPNGGSFATTFGRQIVDNQEIKTPFPFTSLNPALIVFRSNPSFDFGWRVPNKVDLVSDIYIMCQGGPYVCFLKGTKIALADGTTKNVEDVTYGDDLLVWNFDDGKPDSAKPVWIKRGEVAHHYWRNEFESGRVVLTTGNGYGHRFFDSDAGAFLPNTECGVCRGIDGKPDRLVRCELVNEPCEYYNVITARHFNLFANGVLASTSLNNLYPIRDMKFVRNGAKGRGWTGKAYGNGFVEGLRLAEQPLPVAQVESYVDRLIERMA